MSSVRSHTSTIIETSHATDDAHPVVDEKKPAFDPFLVKWEEGEPENPQNWSNGKRWYLTMFAATLLLNATFASAAPSGAVEKIMLDFGFGMEVGVLTISLFVAGYCVGPLFWGPISEQYGRRPVFLVAFFVYTCFQVGCALSPNTASILVFRFLGGCFAAAPLTNSGAIISDIWDARTRGTAIAWFTLAPFAGPALGPTVAGFIVTGGATWRWLFWVLTMFAGICWVLIVFTLPETYTPVLLVKKAKRLRLETGDDRYYAPLEKDDFTFLQRVEHVVARPFRILFQEPMLLAITIYMSFVYGCLYLLFEAYPRVFTEAHGFNPGISGLMFLPLPLGGLLAVLSYVFYFNPRYVRAANEYAPYPVPPEFRLEMAIIAAPLFAISFFWFAWSSPAHISYWAPMMSGFLLGFSICYIFLALFNYIIDAYLFVAASALASNTVARSLAGAGFPLFANQMYSGLGTPWASSLVGFVALAMMPIPFVLTRYGPTLRIKSKYAPTTHHTPIGPADPRPAEPPLTKIQSLSTRSRTIGMRSATMTSSIAA